MPNIHLSTHIEILPIDHLIPYARNSRTHSREQVEQIGRSIKEFGFTNPVLIDPAGTIVAGHGRVLAAQRIGMREVPCIRLGHLSDAQRRAYVIADNRIAELSGWDSGLLARELEDLNLDGIELDVLGFDLESIEDMLMPEPSAKPSRQTTTHDTSPKDQADEPTADDYADVGAGVASSETPSAPLLYPVMVQLRKADYLRFCQWRGRRKPDEALLELLDMAARFGDEWAAEKTLDANLQEVTP